MAHHEVLAKFDDKKPMTLNGIVTLVDWGNPHVHVFMNVTNGKEYVNWAVELESPIELQQSGWNKTPCRQAMRSPFMAWPRGTVAGRRGPTLSVLTAAASGCSCVTPPRPRCPLRLGPTPRWPDRQPRLGHVPGVMGYWGVSEHHGADGDGVNAGRDRMVCCAISRMPGRWRRCSPGRRRSTSTGRAVLQDDPMFLNCKPPGGPRQFQLP